MGDLVVAAVVASWTRWVDLRVTAWSRRGSPTVVRSRSGSFTWWSNQLKSGLLVVVQLALGWVIHWVDMVVQSLFWWPLLSPCFIVSVLSLSLSLSLSLWVNGSNPYSTDILQLTKKIFHLTKFSGQSKDSKWCKIFSVFFLHPKQTKS